MRGWGGASSRLIYEICVCICKVKTDMTVLETAKLHRLMSFFFLFFRLLSCPFCDFVFLFASNC